MKAEDVTSFLKVQTQIAALYNEMKDLSKKSPNNAVNEFKLKLINTLLSEANNVLDEANKPFGDFATFDVDELPSNSDVVMILSQYLNCLEQFRSENVIQDEYDWVWDTDDDSRIESEPPSKEEFR